MINNQKGLNSQIKISLVIPVSLKDIEKFIFLIENLKKILIILMRLLL